MNEHAKIDTDAAQPETTSGLTLAVCHVMSEVKRLEKDGDNKFDKYKYVTVDQNKDAWRPLLSKYGLEVFVDQVSMDPFERKTGNGKVEINYLCNFRCWLKHCSGEVGEVERLFEIIPYKSAQTGSILRSYVMKIYLSGKFLQSGGDDHEDPDSGQGAELTKAEARKPYEKLQRECREIGSAGTIDNLKEWAEQNRIILNALPKSWYTLMRDEYKQAELQISAREKSDKINEALPDLNEWKQGFAAQLSCATSLQDLEEIWIEHEPLIEDMPSADLAETKRLFSEAKAQFNAD